MIGLTLGAFEYICMRWAREPRFALEKQEVWSRGDFKNRAAYQTSLLLLLTCAVKVINTGCIICTVHQLVVVTAKKNMVMRKSLGLGIASDTYVKLFTNSWIIYLSCKNGQMFKCFLCLHLLLKRAHGCLGCSGIKEYENGNQNIMSSMKHS